MSLLLVSILLPTFPFPTDSGGDAAVDVGATVVPDVNCGLSACCCKRLCFCLHPFCGGAPVVAFTLAVTCVSAVPGGHACCCFLLASLLLLASLPAIAGLLQIAGVPRVLMAFPL